MAWLPSWFDYHVAIDDNSLGSSLELVPFDRHTEHMLECKKDILGGRRFTTPLSISSCRSLISLSLNVEGMPTRSHAFWMTISSGDGCWKQSSYVSWSFPSRTMFCSASMPTSRRACRFKRDDTLFWNAYLVSARLLYISPHSVGWSMYCIAIFKMLQDVAIHYCNYCCENRARKLFLANSPFYRPKVLHAQNSSRM